MFPKTFHNCNTVNRIKIKLHLSINTNLIFLKIRKCNNNVKLVAQHFRKIKINSILRRKMSYFFLKIGINL